MNNVYNTNMKLLNCLKCHDIFTIKSSMQTRGSSKGVYQKNKLFVVILGDCRVLGMLNSEYIISLTAPVIPFKTNYKWFPILSEEEHHVLKSNSDTEFDKM